MCCCLQNRRSAVAPAEFSGELTGGYRIESIAPNRKISVYYVPSKLHEINHLPSQTLEPLLHRSHSEPSMTLSTSRPPSTAKSVDTQFTDDQSSDEEPPGIDHKSGQVITVNVEIEQRPKTEDSLVDAISLPPLPISPLERLDREGSHRVVENILGSLEDVSKTAPKAKLKRQKSKKSLIDHVKNTTNLNTSSGTTAFARLKRVTWNLSSRFRSADSEVKQDSNKENKNGKENRETIEIIEIPQPPPQKISSEPASPRLASELRWRAKSARTTFGEYHMIQKTMNDFAKTAIFFVHGVGGCANVWKSQIHYFVERGYEIIAIDLIGHGRSSKPRSMPQYHFTAIKHDILILFDRYAKQRNVIVAHSYGTCFATVLARERTNQISHLVLISSGAPVPLLPDLGIFQLPIPLLWMIRSWINRSFIKNAFFTQPDSITFKHAFGTSVRTLKYVISGQLWNEGNLLYHQLIIVPTLLIYGSNDRFVELQEMLDMQRAIPNSRLEVLENCSHMIMVEAADSLNKIIDDFIQTEILETAEPDRKEVVPLVRRRSIRPMSAGATKSMPKLHLVSK